MWTNQEGTVNIIELGFKIILSYFESKVEKNPSLGLIMAFLKVGW